MTDPSARGPCEGGPVPTRDEADAIAVGYWAIEVRSALRELTAHRPGRRDMVWAIDPDLWDLVTRGDGDIPQARVVAVAMLADAVVDSWPGGGDSYPRVGGPYPDPSVVVANLGRLYAGGVPE